MADAADLKSAPCKGMWVRVPPSAPAPKRSYPAHHNLAATIRLVTTIRSVVSKGGFAMEDTASGRVAFSIERPERLSRGHMLLKFFLGWIYAGIPHGIILYFYGIVTFVIYFIAAASILFTGKYPRRLFDIVVGYHRWSARLSRIPQLDDRPLPTLLRLP